MAKFSLYLESIVTKKNIVSKNFNVDLNEPDDMVVENDVESALRRFGEKEKLKYNGHENLVNNAETYRSYFVKKKNIYIYYVKQHD